MLLISATVASLHLHKPNLEDNETSGVKLPESNPNCMVKDAPETHQTGKHASACGSINIFYLCKNYVTCYVSNC